MFRKISHDKVTMTLADTEYSWTPPLGCFEYTIKLRGSSATLKVYSDSTAGAPTDSKYLTLLPTQSRTYKGKFTDSPLYFQADTAAQTLEIEYITLQ